MIRKLRVKLVLASIASLLLVLSVILGIAGFINYRNILREADWTLQILREYNGSFPEQGSYEEEPEKEDLLYNYVRSPELPYETRYFSVALDGGGDILDVDTGQIAAVSEEQAVLYAQEILAKENSSGFIGSYRYLIYEESEEARTETHLLFLDCSRSLNTFRSFVYTSLIVTAAGVLAVLLLMIFLSGRIVKPFLENYEKQKRFITDAGHELKTPLAIITADTDILTMDLEDNEWLADIQSQTERLSELTNSLVLLARMEEQPKTENLLFSLSDAATEAAAAFQTLAGTRGKAFASEIQPGISLLGDKKALQRLLDILLDNAVKYTQEGGLIRLTLKKQKNQICLSVYNTAEKVARESLSSLFDRFYRADQSRNSQEGGYGLGLSIASAIVSAHKGKITASTQDERSLLIAVSFPAPGRVQVEKLSR